MIRNPKATHVETHWGVDFEGRTVCIETGPGGFVLTIHQEPTPVIASSASASTLSQWALDRGAKAVRHDYDPTTSPGAKP
jgi:hypothetical protein